MSNGWIHIAEVLQEMETLLEGGKPKTFSLAFVRANNSKNGRRGSVKHVAMAAKYTKPGRKVGGGSEWRFKDHDTIPIQDIANDQLLSPKYTHIIQFNNQKVRHYGDG